MLMDRHHRKPPVPAIVPGLIKLMNDLVTVMAAEPELVLARKFDEHGELLKRKQKLALEYRTSIKTLIAQPEMLKDLPEETRRALKSTTLKLGEAAESNARTLRGAVTAVQRLIQNIVAHIKSEVLAKPGYKNPNASHLELGKYSPTCKPVAIRTSV